MFDLKEASEGRESNSVSYQQTGVYDNVIISEVVLEETSKQNVPYMRLITKGANGEIGTGPKMFLGNDKEKAKAEGKKTTGWGVTARVLIELIKSTYNCSEDDAMSKISGITSNQQLIEKVSAVLVGKPFRAKFKGNIGSDGRIWPELGQSESMRVEPTKMKFDEFRDIKPFTGNSTTTTSNTESVAAVNPDDLPF